MKINPRYEEPIMCSKRSENHYVHHVLKVNNMHMNGFYKFIISSENLQIRRNVNAKHAAPSKQTAL